MPRGGVCWLLALTLGWRFGACWVVVYCVDFVLAGCYGLVILVCIGAPPTWVVVDNLQLSPVVTVLMGFMGWGYLINLCLTLFGGGHSY